MIAFIVLALVGYTAANVCQTACPAIYAPVCGSDGNTYPSKCNLDAKACLGSKMLRVQHQGECKKPNPCAVACPAIYAPVCGSDGKTYPSKCNLDAKACLGNKMLRVQYQGECKKTNPCPLVCPSIYAPVCGSDGKTYASKCNLDAKACLGNKMLRVQYQGECSKRCLIMCNRMSAPVCGSDGKTYSNECVLRTAACEAKKAITIVHDGPCSQDTDNKCAIGCPRNLNPVCGSDGNNYDNECLLKTAACQQGKAISVIKDKAFNDDCSECNKACTRIYLPVCGSDGKTHSNECMMKAAACEQKEAIIAVYRGPCKA